MTPKHPVKFRIVSVFKKFIKHDLLKKNKKKIHCFLNLNNFKLYREHVQEFYRSNVRYELTYNMLYDLASGSPNKTFPHVDLSDLSHPALGKSYSDSNVQTLIPTSDHQTRTQGILESSLQSRNSQSSQALGSIGQESGYSSDAQQGKKLVSKTTDSMKKFTFKMSGLKDKIKAKMENLSDDTLSISDSLDSMSIRTDSSDDDMDFEELSLDDLEIPAFKKTRPESESMSTDTADDLSSFCAEQNAAEARGKERVIN